MTIFFTDALIDDIDKFIAQVPPERGGALLAAGPTLHYLIEDTEADYTSASWQISAALTGSVQTAEFESRGRLAGTVHSHPSGVPDPSDQDLRSTARALDANPHLEQLVICIVTTGEPRRGDLRVGDQSRLSVHVARRGPNGGCLVQRSRARVLPIFADLSEHGISPDDVREVDWEGVTYLGLPAEREAPATVILIPASYPDAGPLVVDGFDGQNPGLRRPTSWDPTLPSGWQMAKIVSTIGQSKRGDGDVMVTPGKRGRSPSHGFEDRTSPLVGSLRSKCVLVVGLGSVGSTVANQLVRAGAGNLVLVDPDVVEGSNLSRTTFESNQVGMRKCDAVAELASRVNPAIVARCLGSSIAEILDDLPDLCAQADLVVAATDDAAGQSTLSHYSYAAGTPLLAAALYRKAAAGEVVVSVPELNTPCWSCAVGGRALGDLPNKDYGTGRLVGEIALGPPIHIVSLVASNLAIALLAGPTTLAGKSIAGLLASRRTTGIIATTPDWGFFPELFEEQRGHQWAPQSVWAVPQRSANCPICGENREVPRSDIGTAIRSTIDRLAAAEQDSGQEQSTESDFQKEISNGNQTRKRQQDDLTEGEASCGPEGKAGFARLKKVPRWLKCASRRLPWAERPSAPLAGGGDVEAVDEPAALVK